MNTVVVAGAGTGKTYALVQNYLKTLLEPDAQGKPRFAQQILAVTFTEKAASEMRTRVATQLLKMARDEGPTTSARAKQLRALSRGLLSAPICTFHSFGMQVLREYGARVGIDTNFSLLTPDDDHELALELAEATVLDALGAEHPWVGQLIARFSLRRFDDSKGLAEGLVGLYQDSVEHGIAPEQIPLPRFAKEDAGRLLADVQNALREFQNAPKQSEGTKAKLVAIEAALAAFAAVDADGVDSEVAYSATFRELRALMGGNFGSAEHRKALVLATSKLGSFLCDAYTFPETQALRALLEQFAVRVDEHKKQMAVLGFSDLLRLTRKLLREDLKVRRALKSRFCRVLVDEFQDTSPLQEDIVALICEDKSEERPLRADQRAMSYLPLDPDILFVVGDPKQSIYSFRGADVRLFGHTLEAVTVGHNHNAPTGARQSLTLCRRSQGAIVELVNQVAGVVLPRGPDGVPFASDDVLESLIESKGKAGAIWQVASNEALAHQVQALMLEQNLEPKDIAILCRRARLATELVQSLLKVGVPARVHGGEGFFERYEVMDTLAALKLAVDPRDELATLTVLRSPWVSLSDSDMVALLDGIERWQGGMRWSDLVAAADAAPLSLEAKARLKQFDALLDSVRAGIGKVSLTQAIDVLLQGSDYLLALSLESDADERLANLMKLRSFCANILHDAELCINRFWRGLDSPPSVSLAEPLDAQMNTVLAMTIHQSKGLEFPVVIVADAQSAPPSERDDIAFDAEVGLALTHKGRPISVASPSPDYKALAPTSIDSVRARKRQRVEAELARLLYVALTRAKDAIYLVEMQRDEKQREPKGSLLRLLKEGREANPESFDAWMPTEEPSEAPALLEPKIPAVARAPFPEPPEALQKRRLVFASQVGKEDGVFSARTSFVGPGASAKMGTLSHRLLAMAGAQISAKTKPAQVDVLLAAALRFLGESADSAEIQSRLEACARTLKGPIAALVRSGYRLSFEEAIHLERDDQVLEGFVDLVARSDDNVLVVDFKSSKHRASLPETLAQLDAYAAAIQANTSAPVQVAACVIGDEADLEPKAPNVREPGAKFAGL